MGQRGGLPSILLLPCFAEVFCLNTVFSVCLHLLPLGFWFHGQGDQCQASCPLGFLIKVLQLIPSLMLMSPEGVSWSKGPHCVAEKRGTDPCLAVLSTTQLLRPSPTGPRAVHGSAILGLTNQAWLPRDQEELGRFTVSLGRGQIPGFPSCKKKKNPASLDTES